MVTTVSDHCLTIAYHLRPFPGHTTSPGKLCRPGATGAPGKPGKPRQNVPSDVPVLRATTASKQLTQTTHVPRRPRHRGTPQQRGTSHTSQTRPDHSGAADHGSTTQEKLENRDKHNQLPSIPGHTRAVHQGTTPTPTQTTQGRYLTHPTRPPSPQHNVIPVSFKSLRRRWRRRRWRRWRRNSGTLYNPPGGGLMEQGYQTDHSNINGASNSNSEIVQRRIGPSEESQLQSNIELLDVILR